MPGVALASRPGEGVASGVSVRCPGGAGVSVRVGGAVRDGVTLRVGVVVRVGGAVRVSVADGPTVGSTRPGVAVRVGGVALGTAGVRVGVGVGVGVLRATGDVPVAVAVGRVGVAVGRVGVAVCRVGVAVGRVGVAVGRVGVDVALGVRVRKFGVPVAFSVAFSVAVSVALRVGVAVRRLAVLVAVWVGPGSQCTLSSAGAGVGVPRSPASRERNSFATRRASSSARSTKP
jgi:hypothetical protein